MTHAARSRTALLLAALLLVTVSMPPAAAAAACPRTSLPAIEDEVMCPICGVPLVNAGGRQAENERNFIRNRIEKCETKQQIKAALVAEYGEQVLALPGGSGFDLAAYVVPVAGIGLAGIALAVGALRWRRAQGTAVMRAEAAEGAGGDAPGGDGTALDADLRRYDL